MTKLVFRPVEFYGIATAVRSIPAINSDVRKWIRDVAAHLEGLCGADYWSTKLSARAAELVDVSWHSLPSRPTQPRLFEDFALDRWLNLSTTSADGEARFAVVDEKLLELAHWRTTARNGSHRQRRC